MAIPPPPNAPVMQALMPVRSLLFLISLAIAVCGFIETRSAIAQSATDQNDGARRDFFESKIRPALTQHCLECHSAETEASGGLLLDSRTGWLAGGDSGAVIILGAPAESPLLTAIRYDDPNLQMPPDGKLPQAVIDLFMQWIADGAVDPREAGITKSQKSGLPVERASEHWAYRELTKPSLSNGDRDSETSPVDRFINLKLKAAGLAVVPSAAPDALLRRLYFDLTGLPPSADEVANNPLISTDDPQAYERVVDRLLQSPHFGEQIARHWMDVVRYAESITLRGFVLPEAWRYRDYLTQAFSEDRPFDQMIREQVAGDLLDTSDLRERRMQLTATTFLAMGNTNLEQQDKSQLEMDYVDEQLEVIGRAFLAQTIGCARCHDHKFDPIPTRDYYALAGILHSAVALKHANLSRWIEQPLPMSEDDERPFKMHEAQLANLDQRITAIKQATSKELAADIRLIPISDLEGIVVDNRDARLVGDWTESTSVGRYVGDGYIHDGNSEKGQKSATFEPAQITPGEYQVRLAYSANPNRASNLIVRVFSADGESVVTVDQRQEPPDEAVWVPLGNYRFEQNGQAFVLVSNEDSDGYVILDAVQFLPLEVASLAASKNVPAANPPSIGVDQNDPRSARLLKELASIEDQRKAIEKKLARRPRYMTIVEQQPPADIPIHVRGDVHNLGAVVPRGFLTAFTPEPNAEIEATSSGRKELAQWLSSRDNPLTARVYANRVWCWLMGEGIVSSVNNFGTTGVSPSHPELLDWLAGELIRHDWSTKHLVRTIVMSDVYRRRVTDADEKQLQTDPSNRLHWRGNSRRLTAESLRDAMLQISGELDNTMGGSSIAAGTTVDYSYIHKTTRRSIYQPVFRNSLPELFEAFDFADASVSIGQRPRSTVATQSLVMLNHPWVTARATAAAKKFHTQFAADDSDLLICELFQACCGRQPSADELNHCSQFLHRKDADTEIDSLQLLIHSLFASLDFRYLD